MTVFFFSIGGPFRLRGPKL